MAARKSRRVRSVYQEGSKFKVAMVGVNGVTEHVSLDDLARHELIRVATTLGRRPGTEDNKWMSLTNDEIIALINAGLDQKIVAEGGTEPTYEADADTLVSELEADARDLLAGAEGIGEGGGDGDGNGDGESGGEGEGDLPEPRLDEDIEPDALEAMSDDELAELADKCEGDTPEPPDQPEPHDEADEFEYEPSPELIVDEDNDEISEKIRKLQAQVEEENAAREAWDKAREEAEQVREEFRQKMIEAIREQMAEDAKRREAIEAAEDEGMRDPDEKEKVERILSSRQKLQMPEHHHKKLPDIVDALLVGEHAYLVGPPGTGKSYITEQAAQVLGLGWYSMSFGPQTPESRLWGHMAPDGGYVGTSWRKAVEGTEDTGALFCGDEIDNGNGGVITTMNQTLAGDRVTFPDGVVDVHEWFRCVVTANTWGTGPTAEFVGRNPLDAAFLDRFTRFEIEPDRDLERSLSYRAAPTLKKSAVDEWIDVVWAIRDNAQAQKMNVVVSMRTMVAGVRLKALGWDNRKVLEHRVLGGLPTNRVDHLLQGVSV